MLLSVKIRLKYFFGIWVIIFAQFHHCIICTVDKFTILSRLLLVCSYECLVYFHYCPVPCCIFHFTYHQTAYWFCSNCWLTYNFWKKEKKALNRQFREIKFPANTIFLRDREIKHSRNVLRKFSRNLSPAKIKENKVNSLTINAYLASGLEACPFPILSWKWSNIKNLSSALNCSWVGRCGE